MSEKEGKRRLVLGSCWARSTCKRDWQGQHVRACQGPVQAPMKARMHTRLAAQANPCVPPDLRRVDLLRRAASSSHLLLVNQAAATGACGRLPCGGEGGSRRQRHILKAAVGKVATVQGAGPH